MSAFNLRSLTVLSSSIFLIPAFCFCQNVKAATLNGNLSGEFSLTFPVGPGDSSAISFAIVPPPDTPEASIFSMTGTGTATGTDFTSMLVSSDVLVTDATIPLQQLVIDLSGASFQLDSGTNGDATASIPGVSDVLILANNSDQAQTVLFNFTANASLTGAISDPTIETVAGSADINFNFGPNLVGRSISVDNNNLTAAIDDFSFGDDCVPRRHMRGRSPPCSSAA